MYPGGLLIEQQGVVSTNESAPGLIPAIAVAILLTLIAWAFHLVGQVALNGPRNAAVGFRLPSLMRSEEAWKAGHAAALPRLKTGAWIVTVLALVTGATAEHAVAFLVALMATVVGLVAQVLSATAAASRAARSTSH